MLLIPVDDWNLFLGPLHIVEFYPGLFVENKTLFDSNLLLEGEESQLDGYFEILFP